MLACREDWVLVVPSRRIEWHRCTGKRVIEDLASVKVEVGLHLLLLLTVAITLLLAGMSVGAVGSVAASATPVLGGATSLPSLRRMPASRFP